MTHPAGKPWRVTAAFVARWAARALGLAMFLGWGSFAVYHFFEWFTNPQVWPPAWVFGVYALHLLMLAGFVAAWRWERAGALATIAASVAFFYFAAGPNFLLFTAVNAVPCVLWLLASTLEDESPVASVSNS